MATRYPIVWREPSGPTYAGSLRLGPTSFTLGGRPTLVLRERSGGRFRIAAVGGTGVMREVADVLARELTVA